MKFRVHFYCVTLGLLLSISASADLAARSAPSRFRRSCEELLIASGIHRTATRALIVQTQWQVKKLTKKRIEITSPLDGTRVIFNRTNRNLEDLISQKLFPPGTFSVAVAQHLKVLDLACGEGQVVEDLLRNGVDALGVDLYLDPYQLSKPYFIQTSATEVPLPDRSFDMIVSTQGPITYDPQNRLLVWSILKEAHRLLKTGGAFLISPLALDDLVWPLPPGWRVKSVPDATWFQQTPDDEAGGPFHWLVLERTD